MGGTMQEIFLRATTALFAQNFCSTIEVMTGHIFTIHAKSLKKGFITYPPGFITFMHFAGNVQGDFTFAMDEPTAFKITNTEVDYSSQEKMSQAKKNAAEILVEVLNTATGATLIELEKKYNTLTAISPYFVFGEITLPNILSGTVEAQSPNGNVTCLVSLNKVPLRKSSVLST
jgi:CheY-specific phosphatase CheX